MVPSWCQQLCTSCPGVCKHQYWASDSLPPLVLEDTDLHHSNLIGSPPEQWGRAREHWNANSKETSLDLGSVALKQRWVQVSRCSVTHQGTCSARSHWPMSVGKANTQQNSWEPISKQCFELKHLCDSQAVIFGGIWMNQSSKSWLEPRAEVEDASFSLRNAFDRHIAATWLGWEKKLYLSSEWKDFTEILL